METLAWILKLLLLAALALLIKVVLDYNTLRRMSEAISEAWSNIQVALRKQISLVNQLIEVVRQYQEAEKLVMLQVTESDRTMAEMSSLHQQTGLILAAASNLAQRYPDLKANQQYQRLIDSIQECETELTQRRHAYNANVKDYNTKRSALPTVFWASALGFREAPYLSFDGQNVVVDIHKLENFASDVDAQRVHELLGRAKDAALRAGDKALDTGAQLARKTMQTIQAAVSDVASSPNTTTPDRSAPSSAAASEHQVVEASASASSSGRPQDR
ncbi:LemA family protein [Tepidimonas alkaliphilus]|uniref:LemA family protein n=1 Tax=Tepidimonas alkaliphilus TaxID=2588942 RepID=A0A554W6R9_9BURK|nr:LemA family protein [Tepidimonas alkaliphilus]TSE19277.1 LemA family protein [Tepidimonas alkaliphilus]